MAYKDPEKKKAYLKAYYKIHKEKIDADHRVYRTAHQREQKIYHKTYCNANPEKIKVAAKAYFRGHRKEIRSYILKKKYGLSVIAFETMLNSQNGKCAICGTTKWGKKGVCVDHNHETGKVRGLLCHRCNLTLGFLEYFKKYIEQVRNYLRR